MAEATNTKIMSRREAKALGLPRYFTGKPCKHGHIAERFTSGGVCTICSAIVKAQFERENPDKVKAYQQRTRQKNRERLRERNRIAKSKPEYRAKERLWREKNRRKLREQERLRYAQNREREVARQARWAAENPEKARAIRRRAYLKRQANPQVRLSQSISSGINHSLRRGGGSKRGSTWDILPYSLADLKAHLEKRFKPGMSWENYGAWHIDHIIPVSAFNFEKVEDLDFSRAWALSNLQPMWARENQSKNARLAGPFQPCLALG